MAFEETKEMLEELEKGIVPEEDSETKKALIEEEKNDVAPEETVGKPAEDGENKDDESESNPDENNEEPPEGQHEEKKVDDAPPEAPKLILGKFKSPEDLEKAYVNLEKQFSQKSQQAAEAAKVFTAPDEFELTVNEAAGNAMIPIIEKALNTITDTNNARDAIYEWNMYKKTGDIQHFENARGFLSNAEDRRLEVDLMNTKAQVTQAYNAKRDEIELAPVIEDIGLLEKEDPEWLKNELHTNIIVEAVKLNRNVDVKAIKNMINDIRKSEREKVLKEIERDKAKKVIIQPNLKSTANSEPSKKQTKPDSEKTTADMLAELERDLL